MEYICELEWNRVSGDEGLNHRYANELMNYSRRHVAHFSGKPSLELTSGMVGDGSVPNPEDLLVAAASSCHMLVFLALCAQHGLRVLAYRDRAVGKLGQADGHTWVTDIELHPKVQFEGPVEKDQFLALHEEAHAGCFIAHSLRTKITLNPTLWEG